MICVDDIAGQPFRRYSTWFRGILPMAPGIASLAADCSASMSAKKASFVMVTCLGSEHLQRLELTKRPFECVGNMPHGGIAEMRIHRQGKNPVRRTLHDRQLHMPLRHEGGLKVTGRRIMYPRGDALGCEYAPQLVPVLGLDDEEMVAAHRARRGFHKLDRQRCQRGLIGLRSAPALGIPFVKTRQFDGQDGCLEGIDPEIVADEVMLMGIVAGAAV